jgi:hypothetical protein
VMKRFLCTEPVAVCRLINDNNVQIFEEYI